MKQWNDVLENAIIGRVCTALLDDGYRIELSDQDGGCLFVYAWQTEKRPARHTHWVRLTLGNGASVLTDYTTNLESVLASINTFAAQWQE